MRFKDKVCLVTGGTSGIGKATCLQFAKEGAKVVVLGRNEKEGNDVVKVIKEAGGEAIFAKADISKTDEIEAVVKLVTGTYQKVDVLVNNAAKMTFKTLIDLAEEEWESVISTNLKAAFLFCKFCLPYMQKASIINVSSVHAHETTANVIPYAVSKAGLEALARGMSQEYPPEKVRINCVAPGAIDTPMLWSNPNVKAGKEKIKGKIGRPQDVAFAICFLASDEASYINGTTLVVDTGRLNTLS